MTEMVHCSRVSRANAAKAAEQQHTAGSSSSSGPTQEGVHKAQSSKGSASADAAPTKESSSCTFPCVQYVPYEDPGQQQGSYVGDAPIKPAAFPAAFPLLPKSTWAIVQHVCVAAAVCVLLSEAFVWLCVVSPAVNGILWEQIPRPGSALIV
jgi:hypothetical protein